MTRQESTDAEDLYRSGVQKYYKKNYAGAIADLAKVIELIPSNKEAISFREVALLRLKESQEHKQ